MKVSTEPDTTGWECSLTEAALGGCILPVLDIAQPSGREVSDGTAVAMVLGTQGQTLGISKVEVSRCVPLQGTGIETVAVTLGADSTDLGPSSLLPLIWPPSDLIDCQVPLLSP